MSVPRPGALLAGRFRVDGEPLGEGRSGVVLPATDTATGRPVALKIVHEHLAQEPAALERLQAEAGIAGRLRHAHVLEVLGLWSDAGRWLLVTERVEGRCLDELGALAPEAVAALGAQIASALEAAHRLGVVHGDVRPGNVLLGPRGALLFDFATAGSATRLPGQTAPEVHAGAPPGVRSDLYGLGVVLYRAISGEAPFAAESPWGAIGAQRSGLARRPEAPRGLATLIAALLEPDPTRRPADAATVRRALERLTRDPSRFLWLGKRAIAPLRLGGPWLVHGVDPATGGPAVVRADLPKRAAHDLAKRLRGEGWQVAAAREGLGWWDLGGILLTAALGALLVPLIGAPVGALLAAWLLSRRCDPEIRSALPAARAPIPPRTAAPGAEYLVTAGILLLLTSLALWVEPLLAILPALLCLAVLVARRRRRASDPSLDATRARIETTLASARRAIATHESALEESLLLEGELHALEQAWRSGASPEDEAIVRAERLLERARSSQPG